MDSRQWISSDEDTSAGEHCDMDYPSLPFFGQNTFMGLGQDNNFQQRMSSPMVPGPSRSIDNRFQNTHFRTPNHTTNTNTATSSFSTSGATISSATHDILLRHGNAAYMQLFTESFRLRSELEAQRQMVSQLQNVLNTLANSASNSRHPDLVPVQTSSSHKSKPTSGSFTPSGTAAPLEIPEVKEVFDEDDYPDVPFWTEESWISHADKLKNGGKNVSKLDFLTDDDGATCSERRIKEMTTCAKQIWSQLFHHRLDPSSWMKKTEAASQYFCAMMKSKFREFCYCNGNWKVEKFGIIKYPDWNRGDKSGLTRANPSRDSKRKGETVQVHSRSTKRVKIKKEESVTPCPGPSKVQSARQIIDLTDDTIQASNTPSSTSSRKEDASFSPPVISVIVPITTTTPTNTNTAMAPSITISNIVPGTTSSLKSPAAVPTDNPGPSTTPTSTSYSEPGTASITPALATPTDLTESSAKFTPNAAITTVVSDLEEPEGEKESGEVESVPARLQKARPRRQVNLLVGMVVPKPSVEVPSISSSTAASTTVSATLPNMAKSKKAALGKGSALLVPSKTVLSARNLYAIEYQKENPTVTEVEYRAHWQGIDATTKKQWEDIAKQRKKAFKDATVLLTTGDNTSGIQDSESTNAPAAET